MKQIFWQIGTIILIFFGEFIAIYAEVAASKHFSLNQTASGLLRGIFMFIVAGVFLVVGYALGFKAFKNIWIVSVISITSILILEPVIDYFVFNQLPTKGAGIGLILGAVGLYLALFYK